jgi:hypothetical protein
MIANDSALEDIGLKHAVQFYDTDERALISNVVRYLADGYRNGSGLCVLATAPRRDAFIAALEASNVDVSRAIEDGQFVLLDAEEMLRRFMVDGYPDALRFDATCGDLTRIAVARAQGRGVRVYGEMVGVLWREEKMAAAIRLEQLWDELKSTLDGFSIFCSYPIDIFGHEFAASALDGVLCTHSTVVSSGNDVVLHQAISDAMAHTLGVDETAQILAHIVGGTPGKWGETPRGETMILQLRKHLPSRAGDILALARNYYLEKIG